MNKLELEKIKQEALQKNIPILMDDTLEAIDKILLEIKPKRILEIGTAVAYSTICFCKYLEIEGMIDTIERDEIRVKEAKINIKRAEVEKRVNIIQGDAVEVLPKMNNKYDVIFIDAAKGKYPLFLSEAIRMIKENGIIIADNILYKGYVMGGYNKHKQRTAVRGLRKYIEDIKQNLSLDTEILEVGDGLAISRMKR